MIDASRLREGDEITYTGDNISCCTRGKVYKVRVNSGVPQIQCDMRLGQYLHGFTASQEAQFSPFIQQSAGWVGVDLDGTLAVYDRWHGPYHIGAPIPLMVERVKRWLAQGRDVRVFTARVTDLPTNADGTEHDVGQVEVCIGVWCMKHLGKVLPVTNVKDWHMMELWDDRAVQVRMNTGVTLADELEAIKSAEAKPKYDGGQT